jgi:hypothetical protein
MEQRIRIRIRSLFSSHDIIRNKLPYFAGADTRSEQAASRPRPAESHTRQQGDGEAPATPATRHHKAGKAENYKKKKTK